MTPDPNRLSPTRPSTHGLTPPLSASPLTGSAASADRSRPPFHFLRHFLRATLRHFLRVMSTTGVVFDEAHRHHTPGKSHPERPARAEAVVRALQASGAWSRLRPVPAREATEDEVLRAHAVSHLGALQRRSEAAGAGEEAGDMYWTTASLSVALRAAGGAVDLVHGVLEGHLANGFGVLRPPSHHAGRDSASGFCHLNAAAIAAKAAIARHGARRVAILDWDVHHGDGTQDIVADDPAILYISIHRHDRGAFFPHTGSIADGPPRGHPAYGTVVNVPWPAGGLGDGELALAYDVVAAPILRAFAPDVVIVSAGFDAAAGDPLGGMFASPAGFAYLTARLRAVAAGRTVLLLEGGYSMDALARCASACVAELGREGPDAAAPPRPLPPALAPDAVACVLRTAAHHAARAWPALWGPTGPLLAAASAAGGGDCGGSSSDEEEEEEERGGGKGEKVSTPPAPLPAPAAVAELATLQRALGGRDMDPAAVPSLLFRLLAATRALAAGPGALGRCWPNARLYERSPGDGATGGLSRSAWEKRGAVTVVLAPPAAHIPGASPRLLLLSAPGSCIAEAPLEPGGEGPSTGPAAAGELSPALVLAGGGDFDLSPRSVVLAVARGEWPTYALRLASEADAAGVAEEWRRMGGRVEEGVAASTGVPPQGVNPGMGASAPGVECPSLQEAARRRFEAMRNRRRRASTASGKPPIPPASGEGVPARTAAGAGAGAGAGSGAEESTGAGSEGEGEGEGEGAPLAGLRCRCALAVDASQWPLRPVLAWRAAEERQVASLTKLATAVVVMQALRRRAGSSRRLYPDADQDAGTPARDEAGYVAPLGEEGDCDDEATAAALEEALEEEVTVDANSAATRGTTASLREGEVYTVRQPSLPPSACRARGASRTVGEQVRELLFGMMLPSGNDAATALAWHFGGVFEPLEEDVEPFGCGARYSPLLPFIKRANPRPLPRSPPVGASTIRARRSATRPGRGLWRR